MAGVRPIRWISLASIAVVACTAADPPPAPAAATPAPAVSAAADPTPTAAPKPADAAPSPSTTDTPAVAKVEPPPTPPVDPVARFALAVGPLVGGTSPPAADAKAAWAHYQAGRFADAQRAFAAVAVADGKPWKHPFNLACASAKAGDADMARIGLAEAVRRGGEPAASKARRDADLATVRAQAWFEPVLRGEDPTPTPAVTAPVVTPPSTPTTPATATAPATGSAPAEPDDLPGSEAAIDDELAAGDRATLKAKLAEVHGVPVVIRASLELPAVGGGKDAFAIYDFGRYAQCLERSNKKACRKELEAGDGETQMECTDQWLVRAHLGTAWEIREDVEIPIGCDLHKVNRLVALDLDHDGKQEVLVDVVGKFGYEEVRDEVTERVRIARVLRADGSVQLELRTEFREAFMSGDLAARRFYFADANADGHADLVFQEVDDIEESSVDNELWPVVPDDHPIVTTITHYDPATDAWPRPATAK